MGAFVGWVRGRRDIDLWPRMSAVGILLWFVGIAPITASGQLPKAADLGGDTDVRVFADAPKMSRQLLKMTVLW